jgi:hypothetical protein
LKTKTAAEKIKPKKKQRKRGKRGNAGNAGTRETRERELFRNTLVKQDISKVIYDP